MKTLTEIKENLIKHVSIEKIKQNEKSQSRVEINQDVVEEYAQAAKSGDKFPAVVLFQNKQNYFIGDGWHRILAFDQIGFKTVEAQIKQGDLRDAILYSVGSNAKHGLRRNNSDKRKSVVMLLNDKEWTQWSDREVARQCAVSNRFVSNVRKELSVNGSQIGHKKVKRGGKEYTMGTVNIGSKNIKNAERTNENRAKSAIAGESSVKNILYPADSGKAQKKEKILFKIFGWEIVAKKNK